MDRYIPFILLPIVTFGVINYLKRKNKYSPLKKRTLFIGMFTWFITEMGRSFYRPYIYSHNINDYFVADTIGNSFGTVTALFMIITLAGKGDKSDWKIFAIIIPGLLFYELLNLTGKTSVDINDMIATLIFGCISAFIYYFILNKYPG